MSLIFDTIHHISENSIRYLAIYDNRVIPVPTKTALKHKEGSIRHKKNSITYKSQNVIIKENTQDPVKDIQVHGDLIYTLHNHFISYRSLGKQAKQISVEADYFCVGNEIIICHKDVITNISKTWKIQAHKVTSMFWSRNLYWIDSQGLNMYYNKKVYNLNCKIADHITHKGWVYIALQNVIFSNKPKRWEPKFNHLYKREYKNLCIMFYFLDIMPRDLILDILNLINNF